MSDPAALERARSLAAERGLRIVPHGRGAWRIVGYAVDLLVADHALGALRAGDLVPQLAALMPGESQPPARSFHPRARPASGR